MTVLPGAVVGDLLERLAQERRRVVLDGFEPHADEWSGRWQARAPGRQSGAARASRAAAEAEVLERLADDLTADEPGRPTAAELVLALTMAIRREPDRAAIIVDTMLTDHPRMAVVIVATALRICPGQRREILRQARRHQPFARHPFILGLLLAFVAKVLADNSAEAAEQFAGAETPAEILAALGRHVTAPRTGAEADRGGRGIGFGPMVAAPFVAAVLAAGDAWSRTPPDEPAGLGDTADGEVAARGAAAEGSLAAVDAVIVAGEDGGEPSSRVESIADARGAAAPDADAAAIAPAFRGDAAGALAEPVTAAARAQMAALPAAASTAAEVPPDLADADGEAGGLVASVERPQEALTATADEGRDSGADMALRTGEPGWSLAPGLLDADAPATGPSAAMTGGDAGPGDAVPASGLVLDDARPAVDHAPPAPDLPALAGLAADVAADRSGPDGEAVEVTGQADLGPAPTVAVDMSAALLDGDATLATEAAVAATVGELATASTAVDLTLFGTEGTAIDAGLAATIGLGGEERTLALTTAMNLAIGSDGVEADAAIVAEVGSVAVAAALDGGLPGDGGPVTAALDVAVSAGDAAAIAAAADVGLSGESGLDAEAALSAEIGAPGVSATAAAEAAIDADGVGAEVGTAIALGPIAESAVAAELDLPSDGGPATLSAAADASLAELATAQSDAELAVAPGAGLAATAAISTAGSDLPAIEAEVGLEVGAESAVEASVALDELLSVDLSLTGDGIEVDLDPLPDAPSLPVVAEAAGAAESLLRGLFGAQDPEPDPEQPPAAAPPVPSVLYSLGGLFG